MFGHRARPNAAGIRDHDIALDQGGIEKVTDANRGALYPAQPGGQWKDIAVDDRRESHVDVRQGAPDGIGVPRINELVFRKAHGATSSMNGRGRIHAGTGLMTPTRIFTRYSNLIRI